MGSGFLGGFRFGPGLVSELSVSIAPDAGTKSKFSVSGRVFAIAGIKQRGQLVCILLFVTGVTVFRYNSFPFSLKFFQNLK